jgi:hypothetical protein
MNNHFFLQQKIVQGLLGLLCVLALIYCSLLISLVFTVVEKRQDSLAIKNITTDITLAENAYSEKVASFDEHYVHELGFNRFDGSAFAVRKDTIATYSLLYAR